jgi:secondary thiamine-phosphate synthase enzyme
MIASPEDTGSDTIPAAMAVVPSTLRLSTRGDGDCLDITSEVAKTVSGSGLRNGIAHLFVTGSTAGLTTIEFEPGCVHDLQQLFERIAPRDAEYLHHERWGDHNGHSHMRASLLGPHLAVPFVEGELTLGTWQQVILVDFDDRPRERAVVVQLTGE